MKKSKIIALIAATILTISIITGFIYGSYSSIDIKGYLDTLNGNNALFLIHTIAIVVIFFSTLSLINMIIESVILSIEGISIGFILAVFYKNYKLSGVLYALINVLLNKGIYILILIYLYIVGYKYINRILKNLLGQSNDSVNVSIKPLIKKYALILVISLLNDTLIFFFANKVLKYFVFML